MRSVLLAVLALSLSVAPNRASATPRFEITFDARSSAAPLDGRLLLIVSNEPSDEPRMQVDDSARTQQIFGIDVDGWKPAAPQVIDAQVLGYPRDSLRDVPAGKFRVQAVLHCYETFRRKDGRTVKLPMDRGEGQQWNKARYPFIINHGHFPDDFGGFREAPPDSNLKPDFNERFQWKGYNRTQQEEAHRFFKLWTGPSFRAC